VAHTLDRGVRTVFGGMAPLIGGRIDLPISPATRDGNRRPLGDRVGPEHCKLLARPSGATSKCHDLSACVR
jgi:hypothetical protein